MLRSSRSGARTVAAWFVVLAVLFWLIRVPGPRLVQRAGGIDEGGDQARRHSGRQQDGLLIYAAFLSRVALLVHRESVRKCAGTRGHRRVPAPNAPNQPAHIGFPAQRCSHCHQIVTGRVFTFPHESHNEEVLPP